MKIDFVIPWVDGSDPEWRKEKAKYCMVSPDEEDEARFRDWDNLKYWFRGVEKYASWVNRVYFITCGQIPKWLNTECEKLVCVNHKDYIPQKYLPVFSSHPIEHNMHRIQGLSEHFVYFNDDIFLTSEVRQEDFFVGGLPCDLAVESPITPNRRDVFNNILINNMILLNEKFDRQDVLKKQKKKFYSLADKKGFIANLCFAPLKRRDFFGFEYSHLSSPLLKSTMEKVWEEHYEWLDETCSHRFRSPDDVNQYIYRNYQYVTGMFHPHNWRKDGKAFQINDSEVNYNVEETCEAIRNETYKVICVNEADVIHFEETKEKVLRAFEEILPKKSCFEK
uniref:Stealth CR1 domain-containing protein n=1 Tax=Agathobacter sp. TaxID=2021311 RepID=UPI004056FFD6